MTRKGGMTRESFNEAGWYDQWDKKDSNEARKGKYVKAKKQHDKEKGNETSRKTQRRQKSNNDTGHKPSFVLLSALPVLFEKAF